MPRERLTAAQARRVALVAQGFGRPDAGDPGARAVGDLLRRLGVVQIDSVNVLARAHYLPFLARLGPTTVRWSTMPWGGPRVGRSSTGGTRRPCCQ